MRRFLVILFVLLGVLPSNALAQSTPNCQFLLGFKALHALLPDTVGDCLTDEEHNPANGDGLQQTTRGLLVWRKLDNWTAFTDGYQTWVNGPDGLAQRLNTQRFPWEANPDGLPAAAMLFILDDHDHGEVDSLSLVWSTTTGQVHGTLIRYRPTPHSLVPDTLLTIPLTGTTDGQTFRFAPAHLVFREAPNAQNEVDTVTGMLRGPNFVLGVVLPDGSGVTLTFAATIPSAVDEAVRTMVANCASSTPVLPPGGFCFT